MINRVISGGQTGADQAGWKAAKFAGIPTGGWMPLGYLTEDGPRPEFAELYGAKEFPSRSYPARTRKNVEDSHVTLWFGDPMSRGGEQTSGACAELMRHFVDVGEMTPSQIVFHIEMHPEWQVVNIAGNRESSSPGIGDRVERFLWSVFRRLGHRAITETMDAPSKD